MDATERLLAIEEIKQLKARYFRCIDTKDWDGYLQVFSDDCVMDVTRGMPPDYEGQTQYKGNATIVAMASDLLEGVKTVHHGHMPEIEITSPTTARGIWAMEDRLTFPGGSGSPISSYHGWGHYHERYEKRDGRWQITWVDFSRLGWVTEPAEGAAV